MSSNGSTVFTWDGDRFWHGDPERFRDRTILAADSWLVTDGNALAVNLHRDRFTAAAIHQLASTPEQFDQLQITEFWHAALAAISRHGDQFPRVELQEREGRPQLVAWHRSAPTLTQSVILATHHGEDPRTHPTIKGPATDELLHARSLARKHGADEAVLLSPDGFIVEGTTSAILWWRGNALCVPAPELSRVDSVTARSVIAIATALGIDVLYENTRPDELAGHEVWALSALHGIRIVTGWVEGPSLAAEPGRLALWRARLARLRRPLPEAPDTVTT